MIEGKTREETICLTAQVLGISELEAEFIIAMETGEISGDVEVIEAKSATRNNPPTPITIVPSSA